MSQRDASCHEEMHHACLEETHDVTTRIIMSEESAQERHAMHEEGPRVMQACKQEEELLLLCVTCVVLLQSSR